MAANPPPYPPPYSEKDARRQAKEQWRAQREQWKAQRRYWKQAYGYRRPSIVGPVVLLGVGIVALLLETGHMSMSGFWMWYERWWPALLILVGLVSLAEYFWDRNNPNAGYRSIGGVVFLIILLACIGWSAHGRWWGNFGKFDDNGDDFFSMMGEEHDNDVQMDQSIANGGSVTIQNARGDVTVTASEDGQMHVRAHQVVHASDKDAPGIFDQVKPKVVTSGTGAVVTVAGRAGARVDLTVQIPEKTFATVNTNHGDVTIEGLKNNADVTSQHGDVKLNDITGDVHARMDHGDFSAHDIGGHALIDGRADDVTLTDIKGQVVLDGEFMGDTHLEQVGSTVHFHTTRTDLDIQKLGGDLTMDSSDLTANQLYGPVRIVTRSKNIDLTQVTGDTHIETSNGDVNVVAALPLGNMQITNHTGGLTLSLPEDTSFVVNASTTEDDELESDFPLQSSTSGDRRTLQGTVGHGGVRLDLSTSHGNLQLKQGSSAPMPPPRAPQPAVPQPPAPPAAAKHLKAPKGETATPAVQ
ncbi:MAG: DUF4097 family beta strand repeat protein [Silvibacterium sp.]|nr:DUF4097 family beta strand repeat protein [Silvibacterium sp.]